MARCKDITKEYKRKTTWNVKRSSVRSSSDEREYSTLFCLSTALAEARAPHVPGSGVADSTMVGDFASAAAAAFAARHWELTVGSSVA